MTNNQGKAVVVASGDEHNGHPFALTCPDAWTDVNGQIHTPNALQLVIGAHWEDAWAYIGERRRRARLIIMRMGDSIEGMHHGSTQHITGHLIEHETIHLKCWERALELCNFRPGYDHLLGVMGTVDHVGPASESDERMLRTLLHADADDGRLTVPRLRINVNGVTIEAWHKGPKPGNRDWTRPNALVATMRNYLYKNMKRGNAPTRYYLWGHYHEFCAATLQDDDGHVISEGFVCPAWKLKDEFVYTVNAEGLSNVGLWMANIGADGQSRWEVLRLAVEQDVERAL